MSKFDNMTEDQIDEKINAERKALLNLKDWEEFNGKSEDAITAIRKENERISNEKDAAEKSLKLRPGGGKKKTKKHKKTLKKKKNKRRSTKKRK